MATPPPASPASADTPAAAAAAAADAAPAASSRSGTAFFSEDERYEIFDDDQLSLRAALIGLLAALAGGSAVALLGWWVFHQLTLPAFGGSLVTRALASVAVVALLTITTVLLYFFATLGQQRRPRALTWATYLFSYLSPALLVVATVGLPLGSTRLWLDGLSVDQEFRTEYLTRMAAEPGLNDMSYIDVAPYYPAGWFYLGGRLAGVLGLPGWEVFQPWALITLAAAGAILVPVWQRLGGSLPVATGIALTTTALALVTVADEPYAAVVAMGLPPMTIMAWRALGGAWSAMAGVILFLGISATFYTLHTAVGALIVVVLAAVAAITSSSWVPVARLAVMGVASLIIAATVWGPFLFSLVTGAPHSGATATHYLPPEGAQFPLPMFAASVMGLLCLLGLLWLVVRATDQDARALAISLAILYGWAAASMLTTLMGQTLLGFRLAAPIAFTLIAAGVFALADARLNGVERFWPQAVPQQVARKVSVAAAVLFLAAGVGYAQAIPTKLHGAIDLAHTDTDGLGERADRYAADSGVWYPEIDRVLTEAGLVPSETVVLSDERKFQALYPWYSFQAITSHYANPLGEFDRRNEAIEAWSHIGDANDLVRAMDAAPWRGPDALVLRGDREEGPLTLSIADDIYPNNPNVILRDLAFAPEVFGQHWQLHQVGPFVVAIRK